MRLVFTIIAFICIFYVIMNGLVPDAAKQTYSFIKHLGGSTVDTTLDAAKKNVENGSK